jgi:hypothetical protein
MGAAQLSPNVPVVAISAHPRVVVLKLTAATEKQTLVAKTAKSGAFQKVVAVAAAAAAASVSP